MISCIIPYSIYETELLDCYRSLVAAKSLCEEEVEIIIVLNTPEVGRQNAKNEGAEKAEGRTLVFVDSDCMVSQGFFKEISSKSSNDYFIGGGIKWIFPNRFSFGIGVWGFFLGCYLILRQITVGAFWIKKNVFSEIDGFNPTKKFDDLDFAIRLKKYARKHNKKFESLKDCVLIWSTRKFDKYGDWHWIKGYKTEENPSFSPKTTDGTTAQWNGSTFGVA